MRKALLLAGGLLVAACGPQPTPQAQEGVADHSSVAGPIAAEKAPEPTPPIVVVTASDLPAAPDSALTVDGWGPIRIGMTLEQLNAATGSNMTLADDEGYQDGACTYLTPKGVPEGLAIMFADGLVARIDIEKPGVVTYGGLGVGSTAAEVRRVFGADLNAEPQPDNGLPYEYLTIWTVFTPEWPAGAAETPELLKDLHTARGLLFETGEEGKVIGFRAGDHSIGLIEGCS